MTSNRPPTQFIPVRVAVAAVSLTVCACTASQQDISDVRADRAVASELRTPFGASFKPLLQTAAGTVVADELVVGFGPATGDATISRIAEEVGARIVARAHHADCAVLRFADEARLEHAMRSLRTRTEVIEVTRSRLSNGSGIGTSPDELRRLQWNLAALRVNWGSQMPSVGEGVLVAVLDTGVAYEDRDGYALAPDLAEVSFAPGYDFINDDPYPNDDHGHGTHVAGVIGASDGIRSVAPGVSILPVKVLDENNMGTELALAEGLFFAADAGAQVINMSLSFPPGFFPSRYLQRAVDYAAKKGVVMVAAVGNHGADVVPYPAAFRDVIAVGASTLKRGYKSAHGDDPWANTSTSLRPAEYSNRGFLVDVLAPGGDFETDVNQDGNPEAILAQSFAADPSQFDYYYYAGTSQAAAQVSGVVAAMLARQSQLSPFEIRAILGETALRRGMRTLSRLTGRGHVRADFAADVGSWDQSLIERPRYYATVFLTMEERRHGDRYVRAEVEVLDERGRIAPWVWVYGSFTGSAFASASRFTNWRGRAVFRSPTTSAGGVIAAFQIDAVASFHGWRFSFDRPRGFVRIDSCSLQALAERAQGSGIGTSPFVLQYQLPLSQVNTVPTYSLLNFSWGLATTPLAVSSEAKWYQSQYPEVTESTFVSTGTGIGTSPIRIEPTAELLAADPEQCVDLLVRTFASDSSAGDESFAPIIPDPQGSCRRDDSCDAYHEVLGQMWAAYGTGIGTSPVWVGNISESSFNQLAAMMQSYALLNTTAIAAPVASYAAVLDAAGLGVAPISAAGSDDAVGLVPTE